MAKPIRLLIADDHPVLRSGLTALLGGEDDIEVVGEASTAQETIEQSAALTPDVVLMDIHMPGGGLRAARAILQQESPPKVVVLSICDDASHLRMALQMGVSGYVTKRSLDEVTIKAIREAHAGRSFVDPLLSEVVVSELTGSGRRSDGPRGDLTPRMLDVLRLAAWGHTNQEIASALSITVKTVESHRGAIMRRLGLKNRAELVQHAYHAGLLDQPPGPTDTAE